MKDLLETFDKNGDGKLTVPELAATFESLDAGITSEQVRALFLTFAAHSDSSEGGADGRQAIDVQDFLDSFVVIAKQHNGEHARARRAWPKWARSYLRHLGKAVWNRLEERQLLAEFEA